MEDIDKNLFKGGNENIPAFNEAQWAKMEALLNEHLPQKKQPKRFFIWFLSGLAIVALIAGLYQFADKSIDVKAEEKVVVAEKVSVGSTPSPTGFQNNTVAPVTSRNISPVAFVSKFSSQSIINKTTANSISEVIGVENILTNNDVTSTTSYSNPLAPNGINGNMIEAGSKIENTYVSTNTEPVKNNTALENEISNQTIDAVKKETEITGHLNNNNVTSSNNKKKKTNDKQPLKNQLYFTLTTGAELSGTRVSNFGKPTLVYGAGLQYNISERLFVTASALKTNKTYQAKGKDYTKGADPYLATVDIDNVDAVCKITELPVSVGYRVTKNKRTNVFVTAGSSAFIMNREDYVFKFVNSSGYDSTQNNRFVKSNKHSFSTVNVSVGFERKLGNKILITAEPMLKIPVSGVGVGKVKIYNTGVLITGKLKLN